MPILLPEIIVGGLNPATPATYTQRYWPGAVQIDADSSIQGGSALTQFFAPTSRWGVISFWVNFAATINPSDTVDLTQQARIFQPGSNQLFYGNDQDNTILTMDAGIYVGPAGGDINDMSQGALFLNLCASETGFQMGTYTVGLKKFPQLPIPPAGWHHCIWSWDAGQLVTQPNISGYPNPGAQIIRVQFAFDRGGTPADGGGVYDTALGWGPGANQGGSPQPFQVAGGALFEGFATGTVKATGLTNEWVISAMTTCPVQYAYCYAGFGDSFFDLTDPTNLNYFVTPDLKPVNLGLRGRNPVGLNCLFMHTGPATPGTSEFIIPFTWNPLHDYEANADLAETDWVEYPDASNTFYACIQDNGPAGPGVKQPDISPDYWSEGRPPYGRIFTWNGADGNRWPIVGTIGTVDAPQ